MFSIDSIMSTELITVGPEDNLDTARTLMHDNKIHHLPVVEGERLVGLLTLTNVLAATDSFLREEGTRLHARDIPVKEVMIADVATVDKKASLRRAAMFLERHRIGCLPVLSNGKLKGIITDTDFVGVAINLLEQMESVEPDDF